MDKLKTYINSHRAEFDTDEPTQGHFERLEAKLTAVQKLSAQQKSKRVYTLTWLKYAAAAAAILIIAFFIVKPQAPNTTSIALHNAHIVEVEQYYAMQLNNEIRATKKLLVNIDEQDRNEVLQDIKLMLSDRDDIPNALDDEAKEAVIALSYTRKIEALQNLQTNLLAHQKN